MASGSHLSDEMLEKHGNGYFQQSEQLSAVNARDMNLSMPSPTSPEGCVSPGNIEHDPLMDSLCNELLNVTLDQTEYASSTNGVQAYSPASQDAFQSVVASSNSSIPNDIAADVHALAAKLAGSAPMPVDSFRQQYAPTRLQIPSCLENGFRVSPLGFGQQGYDSNGGSYGQPNDPWCPVTGGDQHFSNAYGSFPSTASTSDSSTSAAVSLKQQHHSQWLQQQEVNAWQSNTSRDRSVSNNSFIYSHNGNRTPVVSVFPARDVEPTGRYITGRAHAPSGPSPTTMHQQSACFSPHQHYHHQGHATTGGGGSQEMHIVNKIGSVEGSHPGQFKLPNGFCLGINGEIIVADTKNNRIQVFDNEGRFRHAFGQGGRDDGRLWNPRHVAYLRRNNRIVVFDEGVEGSRMQLFTKSGEFQKKINISFVEIVAGVTTTKQNELVIVDSVKPTCFVISEMGDLRKWFDCQAHMIEPSDVAVWNQNYYICDFKEHCVCIFDANGKFVRKIGQKGVTDYPNGIDITPQGQILVADSHSNRMHVCMLSQEGHRLMDFECSPKELPKVSRCCGFKLTSNGQAVSVIRNTNMVLILALPFENNHQHQQHAAMRYSTSNQQLMSPNPNLPVLMRPPPTVPFNAPPPSAPTDLMSNRQAQHFFPSNNTISTGHYYGSQNSYAAMSNSSCAGGSPVTMHSINNNGYAYNSSRNLGHVDNSNGTWLMNDNSVNNLPNNNNNNNGAAVVGERHRHNIMWQQMLAQQPPQIFFPPLNDSTNGNTTNNNTFG